MAPGQGRGRIIDASVSLGALDTREPVAHVSEEPKRDRHHVVAVVEHHRATAAIGSRLMAPATRRLRHMPRLCAIGHHHLHSEMQRPANRALTDPARALTSGG